MSRHRATNGKNEKFVYGFDVPLQEYFLQVARNGYWHELVGCLSPVPGNSDNLLAALESHGVDVPDEHLTKIFLDQPI